MSQQTVRDQHAQRALRGAIVRANIHMAYGRTDAALRALARGQATARKWLDAPTSKETT